MKFLFKPMLKVVGKCEPLATIKEFNDEPSIFSRASHLLDRSPLLERIFMSMPLDDEDLNQARSRGLHPTVDMRVQRLMPGMYPSIPGWHCDDVPRASYHSQPDLTKINPHIAHYTCLLATHLGVSNTEFVEEDFEADLDPTSPMPVWRQLHRQVEERKPRTIKVTPGVIYKFNQTTIHRATPCLVRGWRIFFRLSLRTKPPVNEPSNQQQQVYLISEENGW